MNNLNYYINSLFSEAKRIESWRRFVHWLFLVIVIISTFLEGFWLYSFVIFGLVCQIAIILFAHWRDESQSIGNELHRIAMLNSAYEKDSHGFEISQLKGRISNWVHNQVNKKEASGKEEDGAIYLFRYKKVGFPKLGSMIQENAFFNHHLYAKSSEQSMRFISVYLGVTIIALMFALPLFSDYSNYSIPRLGLIFLSFLLIYEELEKALIWKFASKKMLSIDNQLEKSDSLNEDVILNIFATNGVINSQCSLIPQRVYDAQSDILNKGWFARKADIYYNILDTLFPKLEMLGIPWAITGSFGLAVQGVSVVPNDIDIITTKEGAIKIGELFSDKLIKKMEFEEHKRIRSTYGVIAINEIRIDIFGDIENKISEGVWENHQNWQENIKKTKIGQNLFPILPLKYELEIYEKLDMEERVVQINKVIVNNQKRMYGLNIFDKR